MKKINELSPKTQAIIGWIIWFFILLGAYQLCVLFGKFIATIIGMD